MGITKEQVTAALQLLGVEFQDSEIDLMLRPVNRALHNYETLRKIDVPYGTEPAFSFQPGLHGRKPEAGPRRFVTTIGQMRPVRPKRAEQLALLPVMELAPLVRLREVSSTDLTKMYLELLKTYGPKLLCVMTFLRRGPRPFSIIQNLQFYSF